MLGLIPDPVKQLIGDALTDALATLVGRTLGDPYGDWLRGLTQRGALQRELTRAAQRGVERFLREYAQHDPELARALASDPRFWQHPQVRTAIRTAVLHPQQPSDVAVLVGSLADVLPEGTDPTRVERAATALLATVAEEIWQVDGAGAVRDLYVLAQLQTTNAVLVEHLSRIEHRLAGLAQPSALLEPVRAQLETQAHLAAAMPPSPHRVRHNLPPLDIGMFIGRAAELAWLRTRLAPQHPATQLLILGIGGSGKSTLARAVGAFYAEPPADLPPEARFDAVIWVSAKTVEFTGSGTAPAAPDGLIFRTLDDIYATLAQVLERVDLAQAPPDERDRLAQRILTEQRTLLIIDNLESVTDPRVGAFLRHLTPPTKALITSREWRDVPDVLRLSGLSAADAVQFLRSEAERRTLTLRDDDAEQLAMLAGGLPLPLRLSVARLASGATPAAVRRWLAQAGSDLPAYCVATQAELARTRDPHCWPLLLAATLCDRSAGAQRSLLAAAAGCGADAADDALAELLRLSLLNHLPHDRFEALPIVARYVRDNAVPADLDAVGGRWLGWLLRFTRETAMPLDFQIERVAEVERDYPNLRQAIDWCREHGLHQALITLVEGIWFYAELDGRFDELRAMAQAALEAAEAIGDQRGQAFAHRSLAWIGRIQSRPIAETLAELAHAEHLAQHAQDPELLADIRYISADMRYQQGDLAGALEQARQLSALAEQLGNPRIRILAAYRLAKFTLRTEGPATAHGWLDHAEAEAHRLGWRRQLAWIAYRRGVTWIALRHFAEAEAQLTFCIAEGQSWGEQRLVAYALQRLAEVYAATGRRTLALQTVADVRVRFERLGIARRELTELIERLRREDALLAQLLGVADAPPG